MIDETSKANAPAESEWSRLLEAARTAQTHAYAPYSNFPIGAALLSADGKIFANANLENLSYGLSVCAERNAVATGVSQGALEYVALVVVSPNEEPARPCGACRQVLAEFSTALSIRCYGKPLPNGDERSPVKTTLMELLPDQFSARQLNT